MKLTTMTQITVDGVMQGNGGASDEDRRNGFERGGWAMGVFDDETFAFISQTYRRADAFLFGRRTYELFAGYWGAEERAREAAADPDNHQIAAALNARPKYLASTTLANPGSRACRPRVNVSRAGACWTTCSVGRPKTLSAKLYIGQFRCVPGRRSSPPMRC